MSCIVVVGAQWGDEAKGKMVDFLARESQMVIRFNGGNNAGHTVVVGEEKFKLHHIPVGILYPHVRCLMTDGMVIDPPGLLDEMDGLAARGISLDNLYISGSAHIILPYHKLLDTLEEKRRAGKKIGTTGRGIGPAYADKAARAGIRMADFCNPNRFLSRLEDALAVKNSLLRHLYGEPPLEAEAIIERYEPYARRLKGHMADTAPMVWEALDSGKNIVFEGAQGSLLDIDQGTYPYLTSSHPIAGGACLGTGVGPRQINRVIGVVKAYSTRVGAGAFPTELFDDTGHYIREKGHEYGTTTGRPRRCGWLDAVALAYSARINGMDRIAVSLLDVLSGLPSLKICAAYRIGGRTVNSFPADNVLLEQAQPVYEEMEGWQEEIGNAQSLDDLPVSARLYLQRVSELAGVPLCMVSVGPRRDQTLFLEEL
ncbi:MAG: adenylosuccinate synthase [Armatimonadetes bacterium]|nr:adenylosuccinate synthase [Armatimonadota bacterium]